MPTREDIIGRDSVPGGNYGGRDRHCQQKGSYGQVSTALCMPRRGILGCDQYLVDTVEGGTDIVNKNDRMDMYPLHYACQGGASFLDVIRYLVENVEGGKDIVNELDYKDRYPLH